MWKAQLGHWFAAVIWFAAIKCVVGKYCLCHETDADDDTIDETTNFISKSEYEQGKSDDIGIIILLLCFEMISFFLFSHDRMLGLTENA